MKKIKFISLLTMLMLVLFSCSKEDNDTQSLSKSLDSNFELSNLESNTGNFNKEIDGVVVGFRFILGRNSKKCRKFGVCEVVAFWIGIYVPDKISAREKAVEIREIDGNKFFELGFEEDMSSYPENELSFEIEEDITFEGKDGAIYIDRNSIPFDASIGEFGGYRVPVNYTLN